MKTIALVLSIFMLQTSASFLDVFQSAYQAVESNFGNLLNDVVSDVKVTIDCSILAVEHALSMGRVLGEPTEYEKKCKGITVPTHVNTNARDTNIILTPLPSALPSSDKSTNIKIKEIVKGTQPQLFNAPLFGRPIVHKYFNHNSPYETIEKVKFLLKNESKHLTQISSLLTRQLDNISAKVKNEIKKIEFDPKAPTLDDVLKKVNMLIELEQKNENSAEANEIRHVLDEVLGMLHANATTGVLSHDEETKKIIKDLEKTSNDTFTDIKKQMTLFKDEEKKHLEDIKNIVENANHAEISKGKSATNPDTFIKKDIQPSIVTTTLPPIKELRTDAIVNPSLINPAPSLVSPSSEHHKDTSIFRSLDSASHKDNSVFSSQNTESHKDTSIFRSLDSASHKDNSVVSSQNTESHKDTSIFRSLDSASHKDDSVVSSQNSESHKDTSIFRSLDSASHEDNSVFSLQNTESHKDDSIFRSLGSTTHQDNPILVTLDSKYPKDDSVFLKLDMGSHKDDTVILPHDDSHKDGSVFPSLDSGSHNDIAILPQGSESHKNNSVFQSLDTGSHIDNFAFITHGSEPHKDNSVFLELDRESHKSDTPVTPQRSDSHKDDSIFLQLNSETHKDIPILPKSSESRKDGTFLPPQRSVSHKDDSIFLQLNSGTHNDDISILPKGSEFHKDDLSLLPLDNESKKDDSFLFPQSSNLHKDGSFFTQRDGESHKDGSIFRSLDSGTEFHKNKGDSFFLPQGSESLNDDFLPLKSEYHKDNSLFVPLDSEFTKENSFFIPQVSESHKDDSLFLPLDGENFADDSYFVPHDSEIHEDDSYFLSLDSGPHKDELNNDIHEDYKSDTEKLVKQSDFTWKILSDFFNRVKRHNDGVNVFDSPELLSGFSE